MREARTADWRSGGLPLVVAGATLWGTDSVLREPLAGAMPATAVVIAVYLFLALFALPVVVASRGRFVRLGWRAWLALLAIAWGSSGLGMVLFTEAFRHGNPTTVVLLSNAQPLVAVLLAVVLLKERLPRCYWPCFAVAVVGAYLLSFGTLQPIWTLDRNQLVAAGLAAAAAALWGGATVMARLLLPHLSFAVLTAARYLFALPFLAALALARGEAGTVVPGLIAHPLPLLLMAALPGLAGMLLYYRGLSRTRASYATIGELAYPASAVLLNWLLLGATITSGQWIGFAVLWLAISALNWLPSVRARPVQPDLATAAA